MLSRSENRPALSSARPIRLARISREAHVVGAVAAPRPGGDQRQRAEVAVAGADRDHDRRAQVERAQELEVLGRVRHPAQLLVAHARPPLRDVAPGALARAPATRAAPAGGGAGRPRLAPASSRPPARTAIRETPPVVDRVDHADVGERRDDHLGHPAQRLGERQRAVGDRADRVEQPQALGAPGAARAQPARRRRRAPPPSAITTSRTTCSALAGVRCSRAGSRAAAPNASSRRPRRSPAARRAARRRTARRRRCRRSPPTRCDSATSAATHAPSVSSPAIAPVGVVGQAPRGPGPPRHAVCGAIHASLSPEPASKTAGRASIYRPVARG